VYIAFLAGIFSWYADSIASASIFWPLKYLNWNLLGSSLPEVCLKGRKGREGRGQTILSSFSSFLHPMVRILGFPIKVNGQKRLRLLDAHVSKSKHCRNPSTLLEGGGRGSVDALYLYLTDQRRRQENSRKGLMCEIFVSVVCGLWSV
jgi:hypothetical protein